NPTFSPDGQSLAFFAGGAIKTVPLAGAPPLIICELPGMQPSLAWLDTGDIVFSQPFGPLMRVPATGGAPPALLLKPDADKGESTFWGLTALPGGSLIVGVVPPDRARWPSRAAILAPGATALRTLIEGASVVQYAAGRLIYPKAGALRA